MRDSMYSYFTKFLLMLTAKLTHHAQQFYIKWFQIKCAEMLCRIYKYTCTGNKHVTDGQLANKDNGNPVK